MCGRAACTLAPRALMAEVGAEGWEETNPDKRYGPSRNVGPTRYQPVLVCKKRKYISSNAKTMDELEKVEWPPKWKEEAGDVKLENCEQKIKNESKDGIQPGNGCRLQSEGKLEDVSCNPCFPTACFMGVRFKKELRIIKTCHWGLVPSYSKEPKFAGYNTINARADNLKSGNMWRRLYKRKRCIVLAEGYFEWKKVGKKDRIPHFIRRKDGKPLRIAGLYDVWHPKGDSKGDDQKTIYSYTIVTVDAHSDLEWLHHRMPAILTTREEEDVWLNTDDPEDGKVVEPDIYLSVLRPVGYDYLHPPYPVTKKVGNIRYQDEDCTEFYDEKKPTPITAFFPISPKKPKAASTLAAMVKREVDCSPPSCMGSAKRDVKREEEAGCCVAEAPRQSKRKRREDFYESVGEGEGAISDRVLRKRRRPK